MNIATALVAYITSYTLLSFSKPLSLSSLKVSELSDDLVESLSGPEGVRDAFLEESWNSPFSTSELCDGRGT